MSSIRNDCPTKKRLIQDQRTVRFLSVFVGRHDTFLCSSFIGIFLQEH